MTIDHALGLVAGLALFLLGMDSMGKGLETACGSKMKNILSKLTSNRFLGVLVGMVVTMLIQSSSATTVMVVGFVNAGMMTLSQAVWVIMGANIGTTITGQLIALDIGWIAPIFAIIGVVMMLFIKHDLVNEIGKILCGFGILFIGMDLMSWSMSPLKDVPEFVNLLTNFSNPLLGILAGAVFTAIIQSSSASVGILQALAMSGVIDLHSAVYVLFGQNIGTCVTAVIASLSANRAAKRTTIIHLLFNVSGTLIFTLICIASPLEELMIQITPAPEAQIANMHTLFNISTTVLLLPFGTLLVKLCEKILPDKPEKKDHKFKYLSNDFDLDIGNSALHLQNVRREIEHMFEIASYNINNCIDSILGKNFDKDKIQVDEDLVDMLNEGIVKHITHSLSREGNEAICEDYNAYLVIANNIERLNDHAMNIYECALELIDKNLSLSSQVFEELKVMQRTTKQMMEKVFDKKEYQTIRSLENNIDDLTVKCRDNMYERIKKSICSAEGSIVYSTLLINIERIGDHLKNIADELQKIED